VRAAFRRELLAWYRPRRRAYPWRVRPTPYRVLVSEVMLQQTQAARVAPAFRRFVRRFPSVRALAAASRADVIRAWEGLGYNRRAVTLHRAAGLVVRDHGGRVPGEPETLTALPGVGPYTAAAVASLGYGRPVAAVDTNVRRVAARALLGVEPVEVDARDTDEAAGRWLDRHDPSAWNQAVMDLGRLVCRPMPRCGSCPLSSCCAFHRAGRTPRPAGRRQGPFEGSSRQVRGAVIRALRQRPATVGSLVARTGMSRVRVAAAISALAAEGLVRAGPGALAGHDRGRVRLTP
jgi:A/G-specific adenine glycosylase